jgi:hypothetical protein
MVLAAGELALDSRRKRGVVFAFPAAQREVTIATRSQVMTTIARYSIYSAGAATQTRTY